MIRFHVDNVMSSHKDPQVNKVFAEWLEKMYGAYKAVEPTFGKKHEFLGMYFDFSEKGRVQVDMKYYIDNMLEDFPMNITKTSKTPAGERLLEKGSGALLDKERKEIFHTTVARGLFMCKRARPDIQPTVIVLCSRVQSPNEDDWKKLIKMMEYLNGMRNLVLNLKATKLAIVKWFVDASFAVHPDFRSHMGGVMTFGCGAVQMLCKKQSLNT